MSIDPDPAPPKRTRPYWHACDERCRCPECGARLFYAPYRDLHACSISTCAWLERPDPEP
jgi:hypothetical protein